MQLGRAAVASLKRFVILVLEEFRFGKSSITKSSKEINVFIDRTGDDIIDPVGVVVHKLWTESAASCAGN
jgi:hypothetical protein